VIHEDKIKGTSSRLQKLKFENADTASRLQKSIFPIANSFSLRLGLDFEWKMALPVNMNHKF
jgi:hypothetical protein